MWKLLSCLMISLLLTSGCAELEPDAPPQSNGEPSSASSDLSWSTDGRFVPAPGRYRRTLWHDGYLRSYVVHIPTSYDGSTPVPLVFWFHAAAHTARQAETVGFVAEAERAGAILVAPNGMWHAWEAYHCCLGDYADDVGFVEELLTRLTRQLNIDTNRIYASGASNGAFLSHRLASELSQWFAAVAPGAGTIGGREDYLSPEEKIAMPERPVSILAFHGRRDHAVPYEGDELNEEAGRIDIGFEEGVREWAALNGCDSTPIRTDEEWGTIAEFPNCNDGVQVIGVVDDSLGHAYPRPDNSEVNGARWSMRFFEWNARSD